MADLIKVVERITFLPDGGSHHVLEFEDGSTLEETREVAPVLFRGTREPWPLKTAAELNITCIEHRYSRPPKPPSA